MQDLRRNQLVWLDAQGWLQVQSHVWDAEAQALLAHWCVHDLPLVVCRQRLDVAPDQLCLGLPAPRQWSRRRLALTVGRDQVAVIGDFPTLRQVAQAMPWGPAALELDRALTELAVTPRVYGSHAWQWLTQMPYLHGDSDIDVTLEVPDFQTACEVLALLAAADLGPRLDGEIVFPDGQAVAWRELQRLLTGHTAQALLKERQSIRLATLAELQKLGICTPDEAAHAMPCHEPNAIVVRAQLADDALAGGPPSGRWMSGPVSIEAQKFGLAAVRALYAEVALEPKPGLVSFRDCGSHTDMDAQTFMRSLFALRGYFPRMVRAGHTGAPFAVLEDLGKNAEARMLTATGGINTHRGAIFGLGLLCASAGQLQAQGLPFTSQHLRGTLLSTWGDALAQRAKAARLSAPVSNGQRAIRRFELRSAGDEAAQAFPVLFDVTLPALQAALRAGAGERAARVQALFATMAALDDTNCVHRGGIDGLRFVQASARQFLQAGGVLQADWVPQARAMHNAFVARRLSPGGSADVLASACWVRLTLQSQMSASSMQSLPELAA